MIAAVLNNPRSFTIQKIDKPAIEPHQVRVQVAGCGICASSLPLWEGREWFQYPVAAGSPGHEGWGIVDEVGETINNIKRGDHVAFLSGSAYAEYDVTDEQSIVRLPAALHGKPFPAEPLGCAMNIFERSDIKKGDTVAIIGIGFLGALLCQLAKHAGAHVIAISRRQYSLDFAKKYGADEIISLTATWEVANKVAELTRGNFCERVIEATGKQEALDIATEIVSEGGRMIIAGYHQDGLRQINMQKWNWKGIDVINAHERKPERYLHGMQLAVDAVLNGVLSPDDLYTDIIGLPQLNEGFIKTAERPDGFMKAIVTL
jgi:threonine dehydrogenase-like Zn-dependent dehydrogenase